mgnify:CR=1 FL=1
MSKSIFLFDVDGTLSVSGQKITNDNAIILNKLKENNEIGIVGGGDIKKILYQMDNKITFNHYFSECGCVYDTFINNKLENREKRIRYIEDLRKLNIDLKKTIENCDREIDRFILLFNHNSCFILGKGNGESIAREGALKIKEISYIHAEGYSTSSLKHGPFALLTENFPVILIAPDNEFYAKNENAYEEIKSRHANILFITDKDFVCKDNVLKIERNESYQDLLSIIPLQLLAYKLSKSKGLNPDMPRNLAKVVTVE